MRDVTFFSGLNEIGGVSILVGGNNEGLIFDFGGPVECPLEKNIRQFLLTKKAPPILQLYKKEEIKPVTEELLKKIWNMKSIPQYKSINIYISHVHQDHMGLLHHLNSNINVYMSNESKIIYEALIKAGEVPQCSANIIGIPYNEDIRIGDEFILKLLPIDHGVPGASCGIIKGENGVLVYTGDYKFHGRYPEWTNTVKERCKKEDVDILITETTTLKRDSSKRTAVNSEKKLTSIYKELVESQKSLLYFNILIRDIERVREFIEIAKKNNKKVVMDKYTAKIWLECEALGISLEEESICIFDEYDEFDLPYKRVSLYEIADSKEKYVIYLDYSNLDKIIQLENYVHQDEVSNYFHADGNPLSNGDELLTKYLEEYNINYHYYSSGGHAYCDEIKEFVKEINPKIVVPIHGMAPETLETGTVKRILPKKGDIIEVNRI